MIDYTNYWFYDSVPKLYTTKLSKFYFHIPEIKKINSTKQLNFDLLATLCKEEIPILTNLYSYAENYDFTKKYSLPLPLKEELEIIKFKRINSFIDNLNTYKYYMYETAKETNHFIGGDSILFDDNYNLLFLTTAKVVQIPLDYYGTSFSHALKFFHIDYNGYNRYKRSYFVFWDTTIKVSNILIERATKSNIYNSILMNLMTKTTLNEWKFVIDKDLQKKWIATPIAPKLEDIKVPLNTYIYEELKGVINNISTYD